LKLIIGVTSMILGFGFTYLFIYSLGLSHTKADWEGLLAVFIAGLCGLGFQSIFNQLLTHVTKSK
jgi:hypothetical protein